MKTYYKASVCFHLIKPLFVTVIFTIFQNVTLHFMYFEIEIVDCILFNLFGKYCMWFVSLHENLKKRLSRVNICVEQGGSLKMWFSETGLQ